MSNPPRPSRVERGSQVTHESIIPAMLPDREINSAFCWRGESVRPVLPSLRLNYHSSPPANAAKPMLHRGEIRAAEDTDRKIMLPAKTAKPFFL
jgi:hypothetical protein